MNNPNVNVEMITLEKEELRTKVSRKSFELYQKMSIKEGCKLISLGYFQNLINLYIFVVKIIMYAVYGLCVYMCYFFLQIFITLGIRVAKN